MPITWGPNPTISSDGLIFHIDPGHPRCYAGSGVNIFDLGPSKSNATAINSVTYSASNSGFFIVSGGGYVNINREGLVYGSAPRTMCAWAYTNITSGSYSWIFSYGTDANAQSTFLGIRASSFNFGGYGSDVEFAGVPLRTWFHFVGVYTGTSALMYVNGQYRNGGVLSWNTVRKNAQLGRQTNTGEYWNGGIGLVSLYNRALSANEVSTMFEYQRRRYGI